MIQSRNRLQIGVELTQHCDLRCKHCLRADLSTEVEFDFDLFARLVDEAERLGKPHFAFTGGEVTLHQRFFDFGQLLHDRGFTWHFVTNGNSYPRLRKGLEPFQKSLGGISVSLDGATEEVHDAIRGKGSYRRAVMAIAMAVYDGWRVTVQPVLNGHNRHQIQAFHDLCRDLGVRMLMFAHTQPVERADYNDLALGPQDWIDLDQEVIDLMKRAEIPVARSSGHYDPTPIVHCQTLKHVSYNIDCHGRLTFCCQLSGVPGTPNDADVIADLREVSLVEGIRRHMEWSQQLTLDRLEYLSHKETENDPFRDFHCHFCLKRFGKLAHQDPELRPAKFQRKEARERRRLDLV